MDAKRQQCKMLDVKEENVKCDCDGNLVLEDVDIKPAVSTPYS